MIKEFELVDSGWNNRFDTAISEKHSEIRIICPFIKLRVAERLLRLGPPSLLNVITRFNLGDFCQGVNDISALRLLLNKGAEIRGIKNLHSKVYLFGESKAIVTSANLTERALSHNHEFGFVATDEKIITGCKSYFSDLWCKAASSKLTEESLDRWENQIKRTLAGGSRQLHVAGLPDEGADIGIASPPYLLPPFVADASQYFVKFFGRSNERVNRSMPIFEEVKRSGSHWACCYPKGKRPRNVAEGSVIFMSRMVKESQDIMIYGRAIAMKHQEGRDDATVKDIDDRSWKERYPHYIRVHHAEFIDGNLNDGISLYELMNHLGANSFMSTQRNAAAGEGNTNPRHAYSQQAAIELSGNGYSWLNGKLEDAFQKHGKLTQAELDSIGWPENDASQH